MLERRYSVVRVVLAVMMVAGVLALSLAMPGQTDKAQAQVADCTQYHVVQPGQNLFRISLAYGKRWDVVQAKNSIANPNVIYPGQQICVAWVGDDVVSPPSPGPGTGGPNVIFPGNPFGPTTEPRIYFPQVTLGQSFELRGYNFPPNRQVVIGMKVLNGTVYTPYYTATTDAQGEFYVSVDIPPALENSSTVAVEAQTASGFYGRNWFYNF
jgi:hypothetical protein